MNTTITTQKQRIRTQLRETRRGLSEKQQTQAAQSCAQLLIQSGLLEKATKIALYLANDGEIDPKPLVDYLWEQKKELYLPVIDGKKLQFARYQINTVLHNNQYGIPEPANFTSCPIQQLDIIFLPLVAFDKYGQRLGMGGGFYDRTLTDNNKSKIIGLAHPFQYQPILPIERWDKALDIIATSEKLYQF